MSGTSAQTAWVGRVLGVTVPDAPKGDGGSLVAYRKALLEFEAARKTVDGQIEALRQAVGNKMPAETEMAEELAEQLADLNENVGDAVDAAISAAADERAAANAQAVAELQAYVEELARNPLVKHADGNPFIPVSIAATLTAALKKVAATVV